MIQSNYYNLYIYASNGNRAIVAMRTARIFMSFGVLPKHKTSSRCALVLLIAFRNSIQLMIVTKLIRPLYVRNHVVHRTKLKHLHCVNVNVDG